MDFLRRATKPIRIVLASIALLLIGHESAFAQSEPKVDFSAWAYYPSTGATLSSVELTAAGVVGWNVNSGDGTGEPIVESSPGPRVVYIPAGTTVTIVDARVYLDPGITEGRVVLVARQTGGGPKRLVSISNQSVDIAAVRVTDNGMFHVPFVLYGTGASALDIEVSVDGQGFRTSKSGRVSFASGE